MDVSNFLKKLKKRLSEKKQNEETEADGANLEERGGGGVEQENRASDKTQCNATSNKQKLNLHDQKNNYVTRELANVNDLEEKNNFLREKGSNIDDNVNDEEYDEEEEEEEEEDNVFFTATSTDTTHQRHRRKSMVSNYYNSSNNMIDEQPPVTLSDIKHYHILKDLPALNIMQANANKQGFHAQRSALTTSLASTQSSQLSLKQKRHMLLSAMQNKAKETSINENHKHAREEQKSNHSMSDRNDDNNVSSNRILEEKSVITNDSVQVVDKRIKLEEEQYALSKPTMPTDVGKEGISSENNIKINTQAVKMLSVDELLSSASETASPVNIDFSNLDSVAEIVTETREITNNTEPRRSMEEKEKQSFLEEQETNVAEVRNAHSANAEDKHNNIYSSKSDAQLDASTECATKTTVANAKDVHNSVVDSITTTATSSSSSVNAVDGKNAAEPAPPSKQTKKLNAFARAKLLAQNTTLTGNDATLNARHNNQIHIKHF